MTAQLLDGKATAADIRRELAERVAKLTATGGRPPGKFHGKPVRFVAWTARRRCRVLHCLLCGALAVVVLGSLSAFVPVAGTVAVAMLVTDHRSVVPAGTTTREPDADAELRRERA